MVARTTTDPCGRRFDEKLTAHVVILLSVPEALPAPEAYPVVSHSGNFR
jgi:hypothetical protein